jgi:hypothetical protein
MQCDEQRRAAANDRTMEQQRRVSAIQRKLDKLDEAFLYPEAIDVTTYGRQRDKLREELTLAKIDHHAEAVDELDVEGILAFAERILPRAATAPFFNYLRGHLAEPVTAAQIAGGDSQDSRPRKARRRCSSSSSARRNTRPCGGCDAM